MTFKRIAVLSCDGPYFRADCPGSAEFFPGTTTHSSENAREQAQQHGWAYVRARRVGPDRDLCPACLEAEMKAVGTGLQAQDPA